MDRAVEEITRWAPPVIYMARYCTAPLSIGGEHAQPGDRVAMFNSSANRDESVFGPTASRFDLTRHPNPHLARVRHPLLPGRPPRPGREPERRCRSVCPVSTR